MVPQTRDQHLRLADDMIAREVNGRRWFMKRFCSLVSIAIIFFISGGTAYANDRPAGVPEQARWAKGDRITGGDTIVLMDRTRVRLHGIDTPERDQPYGSEATAALKHMVETSVYIVEVDTDRYGRIVGQLYHSTEGYDINASMVCAGLRVGLL